RRRLACSSPHRAAWLRRSWKLSQRLGHGATLYRASQRSTGDHGRQHLWNKQRQRDVDKEKADERGHAEEMNVARALVIPEKRSELLELDGLPEHEARPDHQQHAQDGERVEHFLHRVAHAKLVFEPAAQEIQNVGDELARLDRRELATEMAGRDPVDHKESDAKEE